MVYPSSKRSLLLNNEKVFGALLVKGYFEQKARGHLNFQSFTVSVIIICFPQFHVVFCSVKCDSSYITPKEAERGEE